jgi:DNA processing protein
MLSSADTFILAAGTEGFPLQLAHTLGKSAPSVLYCRGNSKILSYPAVGFCGSRKASEKGLETADDCAAQAAENGVVVASGNAAGVDLHAHYQALANGGCTILVLPEGIEHFRIRKEFEKVWDWDRVLVVSQFEPSTPWRSYHAMARNKIIIGLSRAMIVIEAGSTGGTLDAGKSTLKVNLPLFVAQYENINSEASGNQILIELGGFPLNRLRSTNRANMKRVWQSFEDPDVACLRPRLL